MAKQEAIKQILFQWEGKSTTGQIKRGQQTAPSEAVVRAQLRRQGINPTQVRKQNKRSLRGKKIKPVDIAIFTRQLATMMGAGVPLVQSFEIIGRGHANPAMQTLLLGIKAEIEAGSSLTEALATQPRYFDPLFLHLIAAGERSGALENLLDKVAIYKEKAEALKAKIKKALTYPTAVIIVAFIVTGILLYYVVPQFQNLFSSFGADLPAFTRMVINLSQFVQSWWWIILMGMAGAIMGISYLNRTSPAFRKNRDRISLRLPIFGPLLTKAAIARYSRTLATMFSAGVPLVEALESVSGATGNIVYQEAVLELREQVAVGQQLNVAMQGTGLFPNMVVQMMAIGEESGSLDAMSAKVADFYEAEVDNMVDNLSSLIEPLIMSILGILVGGLVTAMYLPIFQMGQVV
jgi:type IV pilus assembly protein PilC